MLKHIKDKESPIRKIINYGNNVNDASTFEPKISSIWNIVAIATVVSLLGVKY